MAFEPMNHIVNGDGVTAENYNKIIDIYNATGKLVRTPVDNSQANQTGEASIEISGEGTFVAKNLKGAGGDPAWVRYAKNEAGLDMSATPTPQTKFIGFYSGSVASTNPKDYTWSKYVGKEPSTIILQGQNFIITWDDSTTTTVAIDVSNCKTTEPVSGIVTSVNGQEGAVDIGAISTIFESDKKTVKQSTISKKLDVFTGNIEFVDKTTLPTIMGEFDILISNDLYDEFYDVCQGNETSGGSVRNVVNWLYNQAIERGETTCVASGIFFSQDINQSVIINKVSFYGNSNKLYFTVWGNYSSTNGVITSVGRSFTLGVNSSDFALRFDANIISNNYF